MAALPDGKRILTTGQDGLTILWDIATGRPLRRTEGPSESGGGLTLAPDGRHAALNCWDGSLLYLEVETGAKVWRVSDHRPWTGRVAFTPDGRRVLSGGADKIIRLSDVETGREVCRFEGGFQGVTNALMITSDGKEALVNSDDGSLRLLRLPPVPPADKKK